MLGNLLEYLYFHINMIKYTVWVLCANAFTLHVH